MYDRIDRLCRTEDEYALRAYWPYCFVPWYKLFSSQTQNQLIYPKTEWEVSLESSQ
jgi:chromosome transmission fidelity protein 18